MDSNTIVVDIEHDIEHDIDNIIAETTQDMDDMHLSTSSTHSLLDENQPLEIDAESTQVFNMSLQQYLSIDDEKSILQDTLKKKNSQKKNYEQTMITYLTNYNIKNVTLDGTYKNHVIETETKNVPTGFNRSTVIEVLEECLGSDSELFDTIMCKLSERMSVKEVTKLKLLDLSKKRILKKDKVANNNQIVESILENTESIIPENMRYLYNTTSDN